MKEKTLSGHILQGFWQNFGRPVVDLFTGKRGVKKIRTEQDFALRTGLLEKMAEIAHIGAWSFDLRTQTLSWSREVYRIHALDPDLPVDVSKGISFYAPEAQPVIQAALERAIEHGEPYDLELPFIDANGQRLWVRAQCEPVLEDGRTIVIHGAFQDITTRHRKDDELRTLLRQQETILSNSTIGIMHVCGRIIVHCNRRAEEMFGYAPGELVGQSMRLLYVSDEDFATSGRDIGNRLRQERNFTTEAWRVSKDGRRIRIFATGTTIDPANPEEGAIWSFIDVSAAWESTQLSRRLLQAVEQSPAAILITDTDARIEYVNPAFCEGSGYHADELIGQNPRLLKSGQLDPALYREMWASLTAGRSWRGILLNRKKNGELYWESVAISPIADDQQVVTHYLGIKEDITKQWHLLEELQQTRDELEESTQRFEQLAEQNRTLVWEVDAEGLYTFVSRSVSQVLGYLPQEIENRLHFYDLHPETGREEFRRAAFEKIGRQETFRDLVNPVLRRDGEVLWVSTNAIPIRGDDGTLLGYRGSDLDITESRHLLNELHANQELLQSKTEQLDRYNLHLEDVVRERTTELSAALDAARVADRTKDKFLANVSHEMRTPLNVVIGLADLARRVTQEEKVRDYLDKITGAGKNLAGLINDLLDLSKIVAGHLEFSNSPLAPRDLLERCRSVMQHKAEEKGLRFITRVDDSVPEQLVGDPLRVQQILLNLIANAIKFTHTGQVGVRLTRMAEEPGRFCLGIEVEDSGIGIAPADRDKLFQPFYQIDASITRQYGGTGLGLHICKRLTEMMHGDISFSERHGGGSVFRVRLWLDKLPAGNAAAQATATTAETQCPTHYHDAQILAVDDQPINLEIVEELLRSAGIRCRLAGNGQEALDLLRAEGCAAFDLVLMDIQMPVMDGLSATRAIRALPGCAHLPIIALTAHTMEHEKRASLAAGVNDHIGKPFETANFYTVLERWIPRIKQRPTGEAGPAGQPFPTLGGIDTAAGLARFGGDAQRYAHWLHALANESPEWLARFSEQLAAGHHDEAKKAVHALRGRAGMLGAGAVQQAAGDLEQSLANGSAPATLTGALDEALQQLQHAVAALPGRLAEDDT